MSKSHLQLWIQTVKIPIAIQNFSMINYQQPEKKLIISGEFISKIPFHFSVTFMGVLNLSRCQT